MVGMFYFYDTVGLSCKNEWRLSSLWLNTADHRVLLWTLLRIDVPSAILSAMRQGKSECLGGFWSSFFDVGNRRFSSVSCLNCGYTEFYKRTVSGVQQFFDYLGSS